MPALRLAALEALLDMSVLRNLQGESEKLSTQEVGNLVRHPSTTTRRALEDLHAHGPSTAKTKARANLICGRSPTASKNALRGLPEMSSNTRSGNLTAFRPS